MLHLIEDFYSIDDMKSNGWASNTALVEISEGRVFGRSLNLKSVGRGLFLSTYVLPGTFSHGKIGLAITLVQATNNLSVICYSGSHEQYHITFTGDGSIRVHQSGKEIGKTGLHNFDGINWNYFEICFNSDHSMSVAVNGRVMLLVKNVFLIFDRFAFSLPDDQPSGVKVDDLCFDDEAVVRGDMIVLRNSLPFIPANIFGVKWPTGEIRSDNSETSAPWTFREISKVIKYTALVSRNQATVSGQHSVIV
jgi:hypothetical protein